MGKLYYTCITRLPEDPFLEARNNPGLLFHLDGHAGGLSLPQHISGLAQVDSFTVQSDGFYQKDGFPK